MNEHSSTPTLNQLEAALGHSFARPELLELALTHPSWLQEKKLAPSHSNQRLEFLGDAVLALLISERLYREFPEEPEGVLSHRRATLVKGAHLVEIAKILSLDTFIRCGKSELNEGRRGLSSRLEDALEAVIGAVYLDGGLDAARNLINNLYRNLEPMHENGKDDHNAKGRFQEYVQEIGGTTDEIVYELVGSSGPDHDRTFEVVLLYKGEKVGSGSGRSRKSAESEAARQGLACLQADGNGIP